MCFNATPENLWDLQGDLEIRIEDCSFNRQTYSKIVGAAFYNSVYQSDVSLASSSGQTGCLFPWDSRLTGTLSSVGKDPGHLVDLSGQIHAL